MLTKKDKERYARQIMIPEIGEKGQEKLKRARVLVCGAGGLGSPVSLYLAAAGVGMIRVADHDQVALSNLNRQILHWEEDRGKMKVDSAMDKLRRLNPAIQVETIGKKITQSNVSRFVQDVDGIVDAMDNLRTRYLLNKAALDNHIPFFHGAVHGFEGRAMTILPGKTACLRCMYRGPVAEEKSPVIGVTPAVIGALQATEVIKYIIGIGELLTNRMLRFDGLQLQFTVFKVNKNPQCAHCGRGAKKE